MINATIKDKNNWWKRLNTVILQLKLPKVLTHRIKLIIKHKKNKKKINTAQVLLSNARQGVIKHPTDRKINEMIFY